MVTAPRRVAVSRRGLAIFLLGLAACDPVGPGDAPPCETGAQRCEGALLERCEGGRWRPLAECAAPTPWCSPALGCFTCQANTSFCDGAASRACNPDGTPGAVLEDCAATPHGFCAAGACTTPCAQAELTESYLGCDYWPTPTANAWLSLDFAVDFGVVVANPQGETAAVRITRDGAVAAEGSVGPGQQAVFRLPLDTGLKLEVPDLVSVKIPGAAYHLETSLPVAAYQFNPVDFELAGPGYQTWSYTNDAALLLPTHVLTGEYLVMARSTSGVDDRGQGFALSPGFVTVVATAPDTEVEVRSSCHVQAGWDGEGQPLAAMPPGGLKTVILQPGEALQLLSAVPDPPECYGGTVATDDCNGWDGYVECRYCDLGAAYDLTGTRVRASAPVAVFSGHNCAFVPFDRWACDHLEEQVPPLETWGREFVVAVTAPQSPAGPEPNLVRILSGADGNVVTLDPPPPGRDATALLQAGQWLELETRDHLRVLGSGPLAVGQFLVGQNFSSPEPDLDGDPAFALLVPVAQFRQSYAFLAPSTFSSSYVNVVKPVGEQSPVVTLDGAPVSEALFTAPVGGSGYGVARLPIGGSFHRLEASAPVGIVVYGFARYTSYLYPGGLDLRRINPVD